ncbi:MAG: glutamate--tRNA ligase [Candidatus Micrarchaeia archaeon]
MLSRELVLKHALKNAWEYGKADIRAVTGKVLAAAPEAKKDMRATLALIAEVVAEVNALPREEIEARLSAFTFPERKEEARGIVLPHAERGKVVTRFPPEPNGWPHIGHAKAAFLDYEAARAYGGKFLLRFDDTNPEAERQEYVDAIIDGLSWLGISWDGAITYASDFLPSLYEYGKKLLAQGDAYVCACPPEEIRKNRAAGKPCACRRGGAEHIELFNELLAGKFSEGEAVVRFVGDMQSPNTAMRDPTLFRIVEVPHYRQGEKYRLWPTYDFEAPILDSLQGVTHAMRTKEYELRDELYVSLLRRLGLRIPFIVEFSRLSLLGFPVSKRLLKPLVDEGKVRGWDDPRLPTLAGLRRRGIQPEAIRRFVLSFGLGKTESEPTIEALLAENRKLLDPLAPRYFFVPEPVRLVVQNAPTLIAELRKHPSAELGVRKAATRGEFLIPGSDAAALKPGEVFRLKDLYNVRVVSVSEKEVKGEFAGRELTEGSRKLQWVSEPLDCTVLVPHELFVGDRFNEKSLEEINGVCERAAGELKPGDIIQFERFGFCKLEEKKEKLTFIYTNP